jgi:hypothetical protein
LIVILHPFYEIPGKRCQINSNEIGWLGLHLVCAFPSCKFIGGKLVGSPEGAEFQIIAKDYSRIDPVIVEIVRVN